MVDISLEEAQLLRMIAGFFGKERVVCKATLNFICGGQLHFPKDCDKADFRAWAKRRKCLFTVMNDEGDPKLVIEFTPDFNGTIESMDVEHLNHVEPVLKAAGLHYVTLDKADLAELTSPEGNLDFFTFLESRLEIPQEVMG